jgi:2-iminobutanoate/2-iminopropanoate deaminase
MNSAYSTRFNKPYPARTTVAVKALPRDAMVEIEMIAKRP